MNARYRYDIPGIETAARGVKDNSDPPRSPWPAAGESSGPSTAVHVCPPGPRQHGPRRIAVTQVWKTISFATILSVLTLTGCRGVGRIRRYGGEVVCDDRGGRGIAGRQR